MISISAVNLAELISYSSNFLYIFFLIILIKKKVSVALAGIINISLDYVVRTEIEILFSFFYFFFMELNNVDLKNMLVQIVMKLKNTKYIFCR